MDKAVKKPPAPPKISTVNRAKPITIADAPINPVYQKDGVSLMYGDSLDFYKGWEPPTVIVSDEIYAVSSWWHVMGVIKAILTSLFNKVRV